MGDTGELFAALSLRDESAGVASVSGTAGTGAASATPSSASVVTGATGSASGNGSYFSFPSGGDTPTGADTLPPGAARVLVIAPPECLEHRTTDLHQENHVRLLCVSGGGIQRVDGKRVGPSGFPAPLVLSAAGGRGSNSSSTADATVLGALPGSTDAAAAQLDTAGGGGGGGSAAPTVSKAETYEGAPEGGVLRRGTAFSRLLWVDGVSGEVPSPAIADVLRVHNHAYVAELHRRCTELGAASTASAAGADAGAIGTPRGLRTDPRSPSAAGHGASSKHRSRVDADTILSVGSYQAAMKAAGAVIMAVDHVASGRLNRVFVSTRPPGHHAGPDGAVPSTGYHTRPDMCSSGFCLFNNVAIGAAYARATYGRPRAYPLPSTTMAPPPVGRETSSASARAAIADDGGPPLLRRIAIVDFDVHHGNGTEAIIRNLRPHTEYMPLPSSWAPVSFTSYKPWLDESDPDDVLFASLHLYNGQDFYPGSGAEGTGAGVAGTGQQSDLFGAPAYSHAVLSPVAVSAAAAAPADSTSPATAKRSSAAVTVAAASRTSRPVESPAAAPLSSGSSALAAAAAEALAAGGVDAPMASDSRAAGDDAGAAECDAPAAGGILNIPLRPVGPVGVVARGRVGPAKRKQLHEQASREYRAAVRDTLLPRLHAFAPDLIFISAGFDAHESDFYHWLDEGDYEWLTSQLVDVANTYGGGRVISVLEGGYSITPQAPPDGVMRGSRASKGSRRSGAGSRSRGTRAAAASNKFAQAPALSRLSEETGSVASDGSSTVSGGARDSPTSVHSGGRAGGGGSGGDGDGRETSGLARAVAAHVKALQRA